MTAKAYENIALAPQEPWNKLAIALTQQAIKKDEVISQHHELQPDVQHHDQRRAEKITKDQTGTKISVSHFENVVQTRFQTTYQEFLLKNAFLF